MGLKKFLMLLALGLIAGGCGKPQGQLNATPNSNSSVNPTGVQTNSQGTVDGAGGGSLAKFGAEGCPALLDLFTLELTASEEAAYIQGECPTIVSISENERDIEPLGQAGRDALAGTLRKLARLKTAMASDHRRLELAMLIDLENVLNNMSFMQSACRLHAPRQYYLPEKYSAMNPTIVSAILYLPRYGAIVSRPAWDSTGVETRKGLLIHEAFRQLQSQHQIDDFSNQALQGLTAAIAYERLDAQTLIHWMQQSSRLMARWTQMAAAFPQDLTAVVNSQNRHADYILKNTEQAASQNLSQRIFLPGHESEADAVLNELTARGILDCR